MTATTTRDLVFDVDHVTLRFDGVVSLNDVSLQMHRGEILTVIDPNKAGKTSLFNALTGVYIPQKSHVLLSGQTGDPQISAINKKTHVINHLNVARTFQNIRLFPALTTLKNVKIGIETRQHSKPVAAMLGLPWQRREKRESTRQTYELLKTMGLRTQANNLAGSLTYGEQRRLEIARALGTNPNMLLLDEPAASTNPAEKRDLAELIRHINADRGISVLLIEHNMKLVISVAHHIIVLNFNQKITKKTPQQIQRDPAIIAAYLGTSAEKAQKQAEQQPDVITIEADSKLLHEDDEPTDEKADK